MKVLVTGGGGFLGSAIVDQLLARGDTVRSVSRGDYPALRAKGVETMRGDLADDGVAQRAAEGQDVVIHTAAKAGVWGDYALYERANVTATERVLDACRDHGVATLVYTSSPSVTFDGGDEEGVGPERPYPATHLSHYSATKAQAEQRVLAANDAALRTVALRPHLIYGPGDPHLIPRVVSRARAGRLRIVGRGDNKVDITYIDNAAVSHLQALDAIDTAAGKAYYIGDGEPVELWPWINSLLERLGVAPVRRHVSPEVAYRAGSVLETLFGIVGAKREPPMTTFTARILATSHYYDLEPARRDFGYAPVVSPEDGFERLVASLQSEQGVSA